VERRSLKKRSSYSIILLILSGLAIVGSAACLSNRDEDRDEWLIYNNVEFRYKIEYPPDWSIEVRDPLPSDDFVYQYVKLTSGDASVSTTINFQGDWCVGTGVSKQPIVVDGVEGIRSICTDLLVLHFGQAVDENSYTLFAQPDPDDPILKRIVESFHFLQ
jgi:hypothetical protein